MNLKTFKIPSNYVLIKPDAHLQTFQRKGVELGIISPDFKYENGKTISVKERNASVNGTVYVVPNKLTFNLDKIKELRSRHTTHALVDGRLALINLSVQREIDQLTETSVMYGSDVEISAGDRVNFNYMAHRDAEDKGLIIDTEEGEMYLIKYDMLYMTLNEEDKPKKMLNGWIIVEPEIIETQKEGAAEFTTTESGLLLPTLGHKFKKSKKNQIGTVVNVGSRNRGYLQQPKDQDFREDLKVGRKIVFDPRLGQRLEYENHQMMSDKVMILIQRPGIWFLVEEGFDLSKLSFEKRKIANV